MPEYYISREISQGKVYNNDETVCLVLQRPGISPIDETVDGR